MPRERRARDGCGEDRADQDQSNQAQAGPHPARPHGTDQGRTSLGRAGGSQGDPGAGAPGDGPGHASQASDLAGSDSAGSDSAGSDSAGSDSAGSDLAGSDLAARGPDLARAVLDAARASRAAANTQRSGSKAGTRSRGQGGRRGRRGYTGPGADSRDPQLFGSLLAKFVRDRGWEKPVAEGAVFGAWDRVVGAEIAAKSRPVRLDDAELTVEAVSTAWATQLRLLAPKIIKQIAAEVGPNVVRRIRVHGPAAPSWRHGPRRVQGRGPGDTYG